MFKGKQGRPGEEIRQELLEQIRQLEEKIRQPRAGCRAPRPGTAGLAEGLAGALETSLANGILKIQARKADRP
jgi:hypothetical protein